MSSRAAGAAWVLKCEVTVSSGVALIWDVTAPAEAAAAFVAALGKWVPVVSPLVAVALHPRLAVVHLHFKAPVSSPSALHSPTRGGVGVAFLADAAFTTHLAEYLATLKT